MPADKMLTRPVIRIVDSPRGIVCLKGLAILVIHKNLLVLPKLRVPLVR